MIKIRNYLLYFMFKSACKHLHVHIRWHNIRLQTFDGIGYRRRKPVSYTRHIRKSQNWSL
jgi:hypothetical protein